MKYSTFGARLAAVATAFSMMGSAVNAQNLSKFVLSDDAAKKTLFKNQINDDTAQKIVQAAIDIAKSTNEPITVCILAPTGQVLAQRAMDGQVPINIETAELKARSVLVTRDSTHKRANMLVDNMPQQMKWLSIGVFSTSGGLPIIVDGQMIGTIGVGGGRHDEEVAFQALEKVLGPQPPLEGPPPARATGRGGQ